MTRAALPAAALLSLLSGCAAVTPLGDLLPDQAPPRLELDATPFFAQDEHQCGPAALAMALGASGRPVAPQTLAPQLYLPERQGSLQAEMLGAARRHGRLPYLLAPEPVAMLRELAGGHPVVVLQNLGIERVPFYHYAVLIGYDATRGEAILRSGGVERLGMRWSRFLSTWERGGRWSMVVVEPGTLPATATPLEYLQAAASLAGVDAPAERRALRAAATRWPDEPLVWLGVGNSLHAEGELRAALDAFVQALSLAPDNVAARNNFAQALLDVGCVAAARREAARAVELATGTALEAAVAATLLQANQAGEGSPYAPALCDELAADGG